MCGILGLASGLGSVPPVPPSVVLGMRDAMAHRGPDGEGLWYLSPLAGHPGLTPGQVVLGHRRLAVIDPTPNAAQPFVDRLGRGVLTYNGELYNDAELRVELGALGWEFQTRSDTETVLAALLQWGTAGLSKLRGMYAIGFCDLFRGTLLIARDPLGVKPLYWWLEAATTGRGAQIAFASEVRSLLLHPQISTQPDFVAVNAYLTTIRTTIGRRTLFESIRSMLPGESVEFDLKRSDLAAVRHDHSPRATVSRVSSEDAGLAVRRAVDDSVLRHLRADVPMCSLLSGGLDSSIIALLARNTESELSTYCSGAKSSDETAMDDFAFAALVSQSLGTDHHEAPVTRETFRRRWPEMIDATGLPLSTPNEVAINEVARLLRSHGKVVALSGEGADELFGGYAIPLAAASEFIASGQGDRAQSFLESASWIPPSAREAVLRDSAWGSDAHEHLVDWYRRELDDLAHGCGGEPLEPYLRLLRRVNLDGLLRRLDSATMLEGVEGRTPFADSRVAALAESLPMCHKFRFEKTGKHGTKLSLRAAYSAVLPETVVSREKASFPLPFEEWMVDHVGLLTTSPLAQEVFSDAALLTVASRPREAWRFAWPMINLAIWGQRWWG
jgi:asparagine synthase (glutamine-hydrolysing)